VYKELFVKQKKINLRNEQHFMENKTGIVQHVFKTLQIVQYVFKTLQISLLLKYVQ